MKSWVSEWASDNRSSYLDLGDGEYDLLVESYFGPYFYFEDEFNTIDESFFSSLAEDELKDLYDEVPDEFYHHWGFTSEFDYNRLKKEIFENNPKVKHVDTHWCEICAKAGRDS